MLDFNQAGPQDGAQLPANPDARKDEIKRDAMSRLETVLLWLLPGGHVNGNEFEAADVFGGVGRSLKIRLHGEKKGVWSDYATGETGSDIFDLAMAVWNCRFPEALDRLGDYIGSAPATRTAPKAAPKAKKVELPPPTKTWVYPDETGTNIIATVTRFDLEDGSKEFRPYDAKLKKNAAPDPRPLYNLPGIKSAAQVVMVEGEKCADALVSIGIPSTTAMGGANTKVDKVDWAPLAGKDVFIWPDNDEAGRKYAENARGAIEATGGRVRILAVPDDKPAKWDAFDAVAEGFDVAGFLAQGKPDPGRVNIFNYPLNKFTGTAPVREWLVEGVFPLAIPALLTAAGDTGKGMLGLDLALKVAGGHGDGIHSQWDYNDPISAFGNTVAARGSVVILSAEDDQGEIHRRFESLDPDGSKRQKADGRLWVVPLPNMGGPMAIVRDGRGGPETTEDFHRLKEQLLTIEDLKLVIIDPLASFVQCDVNTDPTAGAFVCGVLARLATETGAAVIVAHHMNKGNKDGIDGPEQARAAIRGTTALVDGVRVAYALWPTKQKKAKSVCDKLGIKHKRKMVVSGAVVKSNGPADPEIHTFIRNSHGLLEVRNKDLSKKKVTVDELKALLVLDVKRMAAVGDPFTKTGKATGPYGRREQLAEPLREVARNAMQDYIQELLEAGSIVACTYKGTSAKYLDVPGGDFALGTGKIIQGHSATDDESVNN